MISFLLPPSARRPVRLADFYFLYKYLIFSNNVVIFEEMNANDRKLLELALDSLFRLLLIEKLPQNP